MARNLVAGSLSVAVLALLLSGCGKGDGKGDGKGSTPAAEYKTPEEVFTAAKAASDKDDWKTFADCLTEKSRNTLAGSMAGLALMVKPAPGQPSKLNYQPVQAVLNKHGLTDDVIKGLHQREKGFSEKLTAFKLLGETIKDRGTFIVDVMSAFIEMVPGKKSPSPLTGAELKDLKVEGDTARGTLVTTKAGTEKRYPIEFHKSGNSWRIEPAERFFTGE